MKIFIIGGGIGGLTTAIALQREGIDVDVYERVGINKPVGAGLVLSSNAMKVFEILGISEEVISRGKVLKQLSILDPTGNAITGRNTELSKDKFGIDNFTIHRAELHNILINNLKGGILKSGFECSGLENGKEAVNIHFQGNSSLTSDYVIAADGINSKIRQILIPEATPRYAGYTCWRGLIDRIPQGFNVDLFSETWGPEGRFGVVPLSGDRIYWFACINDKDKRLKNFGITELRKVFKNYHFPIVEILNESRESEIIHNDIIDLPPLKNFAFGRTLLLGDAAHATTPNMGQGACQAIEDALFLANCLKKYEDPSLAFKKFEKIRLPRTAKIVNSSFKIGKLAQLSTPLICKIRNKLMGAMPSFLQNRQLDFLYNVDFEKV